VVRKRKLVSEAYDSRVIKKLPDDKSPLWKVKRLCFLLKFFFDGPSGFDRDNFDGWLNLFSAMMNPLNNRLKKVALVLDRAIASPNTLRYHDFCRQNSSLEV